MPGEANAIQAQINKQIEKLKTATSPAEIAKIKDTIADLQADLKQLTGRG